MKFRVLLLLWAVCGLLAAPAAVVTADVVLVLKDSEAPAPDVNPPIITGATVNGDTGTVTFSEIVMTDGTGFSGDGTASEAQAWTYAGGSGTDTLAFTVNPPAEYNETVTIDYASATGNVADAASNELADVTDQAVTNNTPNPSPADITAPTLNSRTIAANGTTATFVFSEAVFGQGGFTGTANGSARTFTYVSGSGTNTHTYSVSLVQQGQTVVCSYTAASAADDLEDAAGNKLANFTNAAVTNNSTYTASTVNIDQDWLDAEDADGSGPYYLDIANTTYILQEDVTTPGTAFVICANGITFDLNGHTITYNDATPIAIGNHSFETVDSGDSTHAENWDWTNAPTADRFAGAFLQNQIYDGDYSLRFPAATVDEYVESEATITLEANTTYSLSGMFKYGNAGLGNNPEFEGQKLKGYVQLIGTGGEPTRELASAGNYNRGIQFTEYEFRTGASAETYTVRVGLDGHANGPQPYYIDDVKIQRTKSHGIVVGPQSWAPTRYPDLTQFGSTATATITNNNEMTPGSLIQGQDGGTWSHAIYYDTGNMTINITDLEVEINGANSSITWTGTGNKTAVITGNVFTSNVKTITSRDNNHGSMLFQVQGTIANNELWNGPHVGIYNTGTIPTEIHHNTLAMKSRYTNAYAIAGSSNSYVHHNTVNNHTGDYSGRGIACRGGTDGNPGLVHDNIVNVQQKANDQGYAPSGIQDGGAYGMQIERGQYIRVYNNVITAYGNEGESHAFRIGPYVYDVPIDVEVYNNTFIAVSGDSVASPVMTYGVPETSDLSEIYFHDNTLITNNAILGAPSTRIST